MDWRANSSEKDMNGSIYEIVLYSVADPAAGDEARAGIGRHLQALPGLRGYLPLVDAENPAKRADLVQWASLDAAKDAAKVVQTHQNFTSFMSTIASVEAMGHFQGQAGAAIGVSAGGIEVGFFRLKPDVSEAQARAAHAKAIESHLSRQPGWIAEYFVRFDEGLYLDLLLAESRPRAEAICRLWYDHPDCRAFVALVQDVDMKFGQAI